MEESTNSLPGAIWSSLRTYRQITLYKPNRFYLRIHMNVYTNTHIPTIKKWWKKRLCIWRRVRRSIWGAGLDGGKGRKKCCNENTISKKNPQYKKIYAASFPGKLVKLLWRKKITIHNNPDICHKKENEQSSCSDLLAHCLYIYSRFKEA